MNRIVLIYFMLLAQVNMFMYAQGNTQATTNVFRKNQDGYACFRIPAIIQSKTGTLLAFAEARKNSCSDTGDIDLVLKRSEDGGKTWSKMITVWDDGDNVCGNPTPVIDQTTGRIILVSCWNLGEDHEKEIIAQTSKNSRRIFILYSENDGETWSAPKEITSTVKRSEWTWYATGPCHGIQLQNKRYKERLVIPANHIVAGTKLYHSHIIYSDDKGETWNLGGVVREHGGNESSVVELGNGDLMLNMRNYNREENKTRSIAVSSDGGKTWSEMKYLPELIEPVCQGSTLNYNKSGKNSNKLLFSNPASTDKREKMTIRLSEDNGKTWPCSHLVYPGPSAYSDLVNLPEGNIGLLYEYGVQNPYEKIGFIIISSEQLIK
ncbi:exo-alpha-sialidase [Parabacteroides sp. Marseille-P3160]|uniref:sialidase family protein n=1 Tax=Parabacteroides sp. Marseille-P3160 TaxID=1917887 RepID=UPI0009BA360A|nr:sialidase family protein [Parabacteroides sp. Marseille-P3160]